MLLCCVYVTKQKAQINIADKTYVKPLPKTYYSIHFNITFDLHFWPHNRLTIDFLTKIYYAFFKEDSYRRNNYRLLLKGYLPV
jgi:hypothetical protein